MQKTLIPASFLAVALTTDTTVMNAENHLYIIREENKTEKISRLYHLFFGGKIKTKDTGITIAEQNDLFCSNY